MKVHGRCHCGAIAFEAEVDPSRVTLCHCTDCQMLTGTAYRTTVPAAASTFRLTRGTPATYVKTTADSGHPRRHAFCGTCGTPIYSAAMDNVATYGLRVGCLTERSALAPTRQIWRRSALRWSANIEHLPGSDTQ